MHKQPEKSKNFKLSKHTKITHSFFLQIFNGNTLDSVNELASSINTLLRIALSLSIVASVDEKVPPSRETR